MAKNAKGFDGLTCPHCKEDSIRLNLYTLECNCDECDEEFTAAEAVEMLTERLAAWQAVARWIEMIPAAKAAE